MPCDSVSESLSTEASLCPEESEPLDRFPVSHPPAQWDTVIRNLGRVVWADSICQQLRLPVTTGLKYKTPPKQNHLKRFHKASPGVQNTATLLTCERMVPVLSQRMLEFANSMSDGAGQPPREPATLKSYL